MKTLKEPLRRALNVWVLIILISILFTGQILLPLARITKKRNSEVYRAMEDAYKAGKIRAIGVSNFRQHHLEALFKTATVKPSVNQILINPSDMQEELVAFNEKT